MKSDIRKERDRLKRQVERLQEELRRHREPDTVRREGEHWYEVTDYFDAKAFERIPIEEGRAFILGKLNEMTIVEVAKDTPQEAAEKLGQWLSEHGIDGLVVSEGVKFLRIRPASDEQCAELDAYQRRGADEPAQDHPGH